MRELKWLIITVIALLLAPLASAPLCAQPPVAINVKLTLAAEGFERPIFLTHAGDGRGRLFVVEQTGRVWILQDGARLPQPFLDARDITDWRAGFNEEVNWSENGLLGLAFHPDYARNGFFFVSYTDHNGATTLARYRVSAADANRADEASGQVVLTVEQPHHWHNGGMIAFGPDGYLYFGLGDGGPWRDPSDHGQRRDTLLGALLRLDMGLGDIADYAIPPANPFVDDDNARPEIWAYGLRNPWRFSFDRATGDLYIGDPGQDHWEEVNFQPASSAGGENYGWKDYEGLMPFAGPRGLALADTATPFFVYANEPDALASVTGGYVYRGAAIFELAGAYLFGDFADGRVWRSYRREDGGWQTDEILASGLHISSFGEDEAGELYVLDYFAGGIWKFTPRQ